MPFRLDPDPFNKPDPLQPGEGLSQYADILNVSKLQSQILEKQLEMANKQRQGYLDNLTIQKDNLSVYQKQVDLEKELALREENTNRILQERGKDIEQTLKNLNLVSDKGIVHLHDGTKIIHKNIKDVADAVDAANKKIKAAGFGGQLVSKEKRKQIFEKGQLPQEMQDIYEAVASTVEATAPVEPSKTAAIAGAGVKSPEGVEGIMGHLGVKQLGLGPIAPLLRILGGGSIIAGITRGLEIEGVKKAIDNVLGQRRELIQIGKLTGEGFGAGISAKVEAFKLGANPFDLITMKMAQEIAVGVRSKGFRGQIANAMADSVGQIVNTLGIDWKQALEITNDTVRMGTTNTKDANKALQDLTADMMDFKNTSKETGNSVQTLTDMFEILNKEAVKQAGLPGQLAAKQLTTTLARSLKLTDEQAKTLAGTLATSPSARVFIAMGARQVPGADVTRPLAPASQEAMAVGLGNLVATQIPPGLSRQEAIKRAGQLVANIPMFRDTGLSATQLVQLRDDAISGKTLRTFQTEKTLGPAQRAQENIKRLGMGRVTTSAFPVGIIPDYQKREIEKAEKQIGITPKTPGFKSIHEMITREIVGTPRQAGGRETVMERDKTFDEFIKSLGKEMRKPGFRTEAPSRVLVELRANKKLEKFIDTHVKDISGYVTYEQHRAGRGISQGGKSTLMNGQ